MDLYGELLAILARFDEDRLDYALCGGVAVAFYGYPRFTQDIDLLIRAEDLARAKRSLQELGYDLDAGAMPFDWGKPTQREVHRVSRALPQGLFTLDLIVVSPVFEDVFAERELFDWNGLEVQIVSPGGLAKMKRLAGRLQDRLDLQELGLRDDEEDQEG